MVQRVPQLGKFVFCMYDMGILLTLGTNMLQFFIATLPLLLTGSVLTISAFLTGSTYLDVDRTAEVVLQWFFIMLPFTALLDPAMIFFFNETSALMAL